MDLTEYIIDDRIFNVKFSCDVSKCKGACCTIKGSEGAPLLEKEVGIIEKLVPVVEDYLADVNKSVIKDSGYYVKNDDEYSLNNVNGDDCVFSYYDKGIAKCSFQSAYYDGKIEFMKPVSCHLFPVRVSGEKRNIMRYEKFHECEDALYKGQAEDISVFGFTKEALVREYGLELYKELKKKFITENE